MNGVFTRHDIHNAFVTIVIIAPHLFDGLFSVEHVAIMSGQRVQKIELYRRQIDALFLNPHLPGGWIDT